MKKIKMLIAAAIAAVLLLAVIAAGTPDGKGPWFLDRTRTNDWNWADDGPAPVMTYHGTVYTGMLLTNIQFLRGTGVTGTLQVVNGVVTSVQ